MSFGNDYKETSFLHDTRDWHVENEPFDNERLLNSVVNAFTEEPEMKLEYYQIANTSLAICIQICDKINQYFIKKSTNNLSKELLKEFIYVSFFECGYNKAARAYIVDKYSQK